MRLIKALSLSLACVGWACAQPKAVLESSQFDFGRIPQGSRVLHRFVLANGGDAPLEIIRLQPGCGCTTAVVGQKTLAPGERTELEVAFNPGGFRGPVQKTVDVVTNDPARPRQALDIRADVMGDILLASDQIPMLDLAPTDRRRVTVKLESGTGQPIAVTDVDLSPAPWLGVATREVGQDVFVDLDLLARRLPRDRQAGTDTVTLHLENPRPNAVTLKVNWAKLPLVSATPEWLAWAESAGKDLAATVTVARRDKKPFRILGARTTSALLKAEDLTPGAAAAHQVRIVLGEAAGPGTYEEKVTLDLDVPDQRELDLRVSAVLR